MLLASLQLRTASPIRYSHPCRRFNSHPQVAKQSKAAMSMCQWVRAMDTYAAVFKMVEPKRLALAAAQVRRDPQVATAHCDRAPVCELRAL